jgi:MFS family permease
VAAVPRSGPASGVDGTAFRRLLVAWGVSVLGDGVRMVALPLVAALMTGSPLAVTAVAAAELVPWLLFSVPSGALVDRWDARTALLVAHLVRAALSGVLVVALLQSSSTVALLCALAFLLTVAETFADAASQVLLVGAAGPADLVPANARVRTVESLTLHLAGPLLGGVLVAVQPALAFAVDGLTFLAAAALVTSLPRALVAEDGGGGPAEPLLRAVREGVRAVLADRGLRLVVSVMAWTSLATGAVEAITILYALQVLDLPIALVPFVLVLQAVGLLVGSRLVTPTASRWGEGSVMTLALVLVGGAYVVIGLVPRVPVVLTCYLVTGIGFALWNVLASARRQRLTPEGLLGRVSNASRAVTWGAMPLGALVAGVLATATSMAVVHVAAGVLVLVVAGLTRAALRAAHRSGSPLRQPATA